MSYIKTIQYVCGTGDLDDSCIDTGGVCPTDPSPMQLFTSNCVPVSGEVCKESIRMNDNYSSPLMCDLAHVCASFGHRFVELGVSDGGLSESTAMKRIRDIFDKSWLPACDESTVKSLCTSLKSSPSACKFETDSYVNNLSHQVVNCALLVYRPTSLGDPDVLGCLSDTEYSPSSLRSHLRLACESFFTKATECFPRLSVTCTDCSDRLNVIVPNHNCIPQGFSSYGFPFALLHLSVSISLNGSPHKEPNIRFLKEEVESDVYTVRELPCLSVSDLRDVFVPSPFFSTSQIILFLILVLVIFLQFLYSE